MNYFGHEKKWNYSIFMLCTLYIDLEVPLTSDELRAISDEIADIWKGVGLELGLSPLKLDTIEQLCNLNHEVNPSLDMLLKWKEANKNVSRRKLNQAIEECQDNGGIGC